MSRGARILLAIAVLVIGIPVWIVVAVTVMDRAQSWFGPLPFWAETLGWIVLGLVWMLPMRRVFLGVAARGSAPRKFLDDPPA